MSRLGRPSIYDRDLFVTMDGLPKYVGVDAAGQQSRCGLTIDRVRLPADENVRI